MTALVHHFPLLVQAAIGAASKVATCDLQHQILDHSTTVVESAVNLVSAAREVRGDPHNHDGHKKVDEEARLLQEAVRELIEVAEGATHKNRLVGGQCMTVASNWIVHGTIVNALPTIRLKGPEKV